MIRGSRPGRAVAALCVAVRQLCRRVLGQTSALTVTVGGSDTQDEPSHQLLTDGGAATGWRFGRVTRILLAGVGLVLVGLTMVVLFRPATLPLEQLPVSRLPDSIRNNLLRGLGVTALTGGILLYLGRHVVGIGRQAASSRDTDPLPYPPESIQTAPAEQVGTAFDGHLATIESARDVEVSRIETALRDRAIELQTLYEGDDERTAAERVDTGQWTDDRRAAAFLGGSAADGPSWRTELWDWLRPMPRAERRIRHTVDALDEYAAERTQTAAPGDGE